MSADETEVLRARLRAAEQAVEAQGYLRAMAERALGDAMTALAEVAAAIGLGADIDDAHFLIEELPGSVRSAMRATRTP